MKAFTIIPWLLTKAYYRLFHAYEVRGRHEIPRGAYLLVSNHVSYLDPPAMGLMEFRDMAFMAKDSLFDAPLLGRFLRQVGCIPVKEERGDRKAIVAAFRYIKQGRPLVLFPEGSRGSGEELLPFMRGFIEIAGRTVIPILPVCILGSERAMPVGSAFPRPRRIRIHVGSAIFPAEARHIGVEGIRTRVAELLEKAREEAR